MDPISYLQYQLLKIEVFIKTFFDLDQHGLRFGNFRISPGSVVQAELSDELLSKYYTWRLFSLWFIYPKR